MPPAIEPLIMASLGLLDLPMVNVVWLRCAVDEWKCVQIRVRLLGWGCGLQDGIPYPAVAKMLQYRGMAARRRGMDGGTPATSAPAGGAPDGRVPFKWQIPGRTCRQVVAAGG